MLKRARFQNLRGYSGKELEIVFSPSINLITGKNGAGKTTLLKTLWYLMSGNIHVAQTETPFSFATIETDLYALTVDLTDPRDPVVSIDMDGEEIVIREPTLDQLDESDFVSLDEEDALERADDFLEDFGQSLFFPTFRRVEGGYGIPKEPAAIPRSLLRATRHKSDLDDAFTDISRRISNVNHEFICSVSTNDIVNLVLNKFNGVTQRYSEEQQSLSSSIIQEIRDYEAKDVKLPLNNADEVIQRIRKAIEAVDDNRVKLMRPLNAVQDLVIELFDHRGISFANKYSFGERAEAVLSENLSAGEKQMLSFICYNAFYSNAVIFIDEPELSLHIDWQRQLFPILERQASTNQFVVATHSPFIYSKYPENELLLGSDRGD
ncbi:AAA family ATPase [Qipengyuania flava]|nr:AAA family ATPase [Qipengyuania flava]